MKPPGELAQGLMPEVIRYNEIVLGADPEDPAFKEFLVILNVPCPHQATLLR